MIEIQTSRLVLKQMCMEYLNSTHEYASDPENTIYLMWLPNDSITQTMEYIKGAENEFRKEKPSFYEMAILYQNIHIGAVSLYLNEDRTSAEFGWMLNKKYFGNGFATEAAMALLSYAENELGLKHFTATCDTENVASRKVMEKLGMVKTAERGGRHNKQSAEERREYLYELEI